jgi:hypothetical protein
MAIRHHHRLPLILWQTSRVSPGFADLGRSPCLPLPTTCCGQRMTQSGKAPPETLPDPMPLSAEKGDQTPVPVQRFVFSLRARVPSLEASVTAGREQVNPNSRNSSLPPPATAGATKAGRPSKSKRQRGGQKGHPGTTRKLVPVEQVKKVLYIKPETCRHCGHDVAGNDPEPYRHQGTKIPSVVAPVTECRVPLAEERPAPRCLLASLEGPMDLDCTLRRRC